MQDGWVLDDEEAANLHDSRKRAFMFMIEIVREEELPGELALSESAVENFVKWKNNENVYQRLQFLESEEDTYKAFGNYWLELADSYYETGEYAKCLDAVAKYEELQTEIFRKDYYLAQMPQLFKNNLTICHNFRNRGYCSHERFHLAKAPLVTYTVKDRKETFALSEVFSSLVRLRLAPSESVSYKI